MKGVILGVKEKSFPIIIRKKQEIINSTYDISIPIYILGKLSKDHLPERVKIGLTDVEVLCSYHRTSNDVKMSSELLSTLGLFDGVQCQLMIENNTLRFGPVVGVFVGKSYIKKLSEQNPRQRTLELVKANQYAQTILYFFCMEGVDFTSKKVEGYYFDKKDTIWKTHYFPFPDVLYDRGSGKPNKRLPRQKLREKLKKETPVQKLNNQHYFNKYDLYKKLRQFDEMKEHLPKTELYTHPRDLKKFRNKKVTYIKKCIGSNGRGIMKIEKLPSKGYAYSFFNTKVVKHLVTNFTDVAHVIQRAYQRKKTLLQEGIDLPSPDGCNIDMRATLQRDGKGELNITSIVVRVGKKDSPVTSTRTGATCYRFEDFFEKSLTSKESVQDLRKRVDEFLYRVYHCTEKAYGRFGEIGIDFALNKKGKIWFIECNAKPAKDAMCKSYDQETILQAFQYPLEYAKYITGFNT